MNTGSFLSSQGGYAFDYITNTYRQSLASLLTQEGYSAKTFHYNDPSFYSRGSVLPAMGYSEYVCYGDYIGADEEDLLYDDQLLFDNPGLNAEFFREGQPTLNFIITRSAHLSYKYNEVLSYWALKKYPEFRGLTGNEETDCAYLKARLVDDLFARLLQELEDKGSLTTPLSSVSLTTTPTATRTKRPCTPFQGWTTPCCWKKRRPASSGARICSP